MRGFFGDGKTLCTTATVAAFILSTGGGTAQNAIDVPSQPLPEAIAELSEAYDIEVAAPSETLIGQTSTAVSGSNSIQGALNAMLEGTGLSATPVAVNSFVVARDTVSQNAIENAPLDLGTLVLLGERVERDVFETSSSVRAYGDEELQENVQNTELVRVISDAGNIVTIGGSNQTPFIRGHSMSGPNNVQGAFLEGSFPRANLTVDGRIQTFSELSFSRTSIWDVETIELFRGPQTTSQGANSIAGAINIRTKNPVFEREIAIRAEAGTDDKGVVSLVYNTPLSQSVALRFSYDRQQQDPYINYANGVNAGLDAVRFEQETARLKLLWEPASLPEFSTQLTLSYTDYSGAQTQNVRPPFGSLTAFNTDGFPSVFYGSTTAVIHDVSYEFGDGFSIRNQFTYSNAENTRTTNGAPGPIAADRPLDTEAISNELILDYAPDGSPLSGFAGVFVREAEQSSPGAVLFMVDGTNKNLGLFAEATYRFSNGFDLTGGVRYEKTDQRRVVEIPLFGFGGAAALNYDEEFDAFLPKIVVGYEPNDDLRFAFQVSRGFNPGGVGTSFGALQGFIPLPSPFVPFEEETVTNYELSMRGRFLNDRLFVSANAFFSDFEDYQFAISTLLPTGDIDSIISNAERVETYGLEIDAQFQVNDRVQITGALGLLQSEVKRHSSAVPPIVGNELPFAPELTASIGVDFALTDRLSVGAQVRHNSRYYSDITNDPFERTDPLTTLDILARYAVADQAEVYAYVNNVTDEVQAVEIFGGGTSGVTNRPREMGFGVRASW